jgi:hypothetical protein
MEEKNKKTLGVEFFEQFLGEMKSVNFGEILSQTIESRKSYADLNEQLLNLYLDEMKVFHDALVKRFGDEMAQKITIGAITRNGISTGDSIVNRLGEALATMVASQVTQKYAYRSPHAGGFA